MVPDLGAEIERAIRGPLEGIKDIRIDPIDEPCWTD